MMLNDPLKEYEKEEQGFMSMEAKYERWKWQKDRAKVRIAPMEMSCSDIIDSSLRCPFLPMHIPLNANTKCRECSHDGTDKSSTQRLPLTFYPHHHHHHNHDCTTLIPSLHSKTPDLLRPLHSHHPQTVTPPPYNTLHPLPSPSHCPSIQLPHPRRQRRPHQ